MLRGSNRARIFLDDEDCEKFLDVMKQAKIAGGFSLYAWCLMGNHVHLLIREEKEPLETVFRRIGASYVYYFNRKYGMIGHLFQDRFRSEPVEDEAYFLDVLRYICQNPVKAGLCRIPWEYPWLGCSGIGKENFLVDDIAPYTDMDPNTMEEFLQQPVEDRLFEEESAARKTDREAEKQLCEAFALEHGRQAAFLPEDKRDQCIRESHQTGISIRQLARISGISKGVIERVLKGSP